MSILLAPAVNGLYSVTLDLASLATSHADSHVAERLLEAVGRIDDAVRQLRDDLLAQPSLVVFPVVVPGPAAER